MKKFILAAAIAVGALLTISSPAMATNYPAGTVPPTSGEPGSVVSFSIQTGYPSTDGSITVEGDNLDTDAITTGTLNHAVTTTADGLAKFGVLLPATATPGSTYKITTTVKDFTKTTSIKVADAQLETEAEPTTAPTSTPAPTATSDTGNPGVFWFAGGAVALVAGLIAVVAVRRNRKANAAE